MKRALRLVGGFLAILTCSAAAAPGTGQSASPLANPYDINISKMTVPHSTEDERKFSKENPDEVSEVQFINHYVNQHMRYVSDMRHYGYDDLWVMAPPDKEGDCEDFAMTKLFILEQNHLAGVQNTRLELVMVYTIQIDGHVDSDGHAILAYRFQHGSVAYLDINTGHLATKHELENMGYVFQNW